LTVLIYNKSFKNYAEESSENKFLIIEYVESFLNHDYTEKDE